MYLRDVMTTDVITVKSNSHIMDARRLMEENKLVRLPVVDKNDNLVGILTKKDMDKLTLPEPNPRDILEFSYSIAALYRIPVSQVMHRDVVTASPDMTVEEAVALAQKKKVGALVVTEDHHVVGIATTNDFFYKILNKVLGIGEKGARIEVIGGGEGPVLEEILSCMNKSEQKITTLHIYKPAGKAKKNVILHLDTDDVGSCFDMLKGKGYKVNIRKHTV
ncbi:MAG: CBS domain-containing protein [Dehalococcoidales bacterium]|nr:CBS domain-containing protein [Dehalococcoidales bacterium]